MFNTCHTVGNGDTCQACTIVKSTTTYTRHRFTINLQKTSNRSVKKYALYFGVSYDYILGLTNNPVPNLNIKN